MCRARECGHVQGIYDEGVWACTHERRASVLELKHSGGRIMGAQVRRGTARREYGLGGMWPSRGGACVQAGQSHGDFSASLALTLASGTFLHCIRVCAKSTYRSEVRGSASCTRGGKGWG